MPHLGSVIQDSAVSNHFEVKVTDNGGFVLSFSAAKGKSKEMGMEFKSYTYSTVEELFKGINEYLKELGVNRKGKDKDYLK